MPSIPRVNNGHDDEDAKVHVAFVGDVLRGALVVLARGS